jgi:hypothetical protein
MSGRGLVSKIRRGQDKSQRQRKLRLLDLELENLRLELENLRLEVEIREREANEERERLEALEEQQRQNAQSQPGESVYLITYSTPKKAFEALNYGNLIFTPSSETPASMAEVFNTKPPKDLFAIALEPFDDELANPRDYFIRLSEFIINIYNNFKKPRGQRPLSRIVFSLIANEFSFLTIRAESVSLNNLTPEFLENVFNDMFGSALQNSPDAYQEDPDFEDLQNMLANFQLSFKPISYLENKKGGSTIHNTHTFKIQLPELLREITLTSYKSTSGNCLLTCLSKLRVPLSRYTQIKKDFNLSPTDFIPMHIAKQIIDKYASAFSIQLIDIYDITHDILDSCPNMIVLFDEHYHVYSPNESEDFKKCIHCRKVMRNPKTHAEVCKAKISFTEQFPDQDWEKHIHSNFDPSDPEAITCTLCKRTCHHTQFVNGEHQYCYAFQDPTATIERIPAAVDAETHKNILQKCMIFERAYYAISQLPESESRTQSLENLNKSKFFKTEFVSLAIASTPSFTEVPLPDLKNYHTKVFRFADLENIQSDELIVQFLDFLISEQIEGRYYEFYAHRGGTFDYIPIIGYLNRNSEKYKKMFRHMTFYRQKGKAKCIQTKGSKILEFRFGFHVFRDSYNFIPMTLKDACSSKNFNVSPEFNKIDVVHHDHGSIKISDIMFRHPNVNFDDYVRKLASEYVYIKSVKTSLLTIYEDYNVNDVLSLLQIMVKLNNCVLDIATLASFHPDNPKYHEYIDTQKKATQSKQKSSHSRDFVKDHLPNKANFSISASLTFPGWVKKLYNWVVFDRGIRLLQYSKEIKTVAQQLHETKLRLQGLPIPLSHNEVLNLLLLYISKYQGKIGGVSAVNPNYQGYIEQPNSKCDIRGMYGSIMLFNYFTVGNLSHAHVSMNQDSEIQKLGFYLVTSMSSPPSLDNCIKSYPTKGDTLDWYKTPTLSSPVLLTGIYLQRLQKDSYQFTISEAITTDQPEGYPIFREFTDLFTGKKYEQDQAALLDKSTYENLISEGVISQLNAALRALYKLGPNALYGKSLEETTPDEYHRIKPSEFTYYLSTIRDSQQITPVFNGSVFYVKVNLAPKKNLLLPNGIQILDYSKDQLFSYFDQVGRSTITQVETDGFGCVNPNLSFSGSHYHHTDNYEYSHQQIAKNFSIPCEVGKTQIGVFPGELEIEKRVAAMYNLQKKMCLPIPEGYNLRPDMINKLAERGLPFYLFPDNRTFTDDEFFANPQSFNLKIPAATSKGIPKDPIIQCKLFADLFTNGRAELPTTQFLRCQYSADACLIQKDSVKVITKDVQEYRNTLNPNSISSTIKIT